MTSDEAKIVTRIMCDADDQCSVCGCKLLKQFIKAFPEHRAEAEASFLEVHEYEMSRYTEVD
jgi:hypothetical protein